MRVPLVSVLVAVLLTAFAASADAAVVSVPTRFRVTNTNSSGVPCASDGRHYTLRGHLTGPRAALRHPHAVKVYLFGYEAGEWNWRLRSVRAYDHSARMASRGHVSLTLSDFGYGRSGRPQGMA